MKKKLLPALLLLLTPSCIFVVSEKDGCSCHENDHQHEAEQENATEQ